MSFNSVGQYTPNHKSWDHIGNMIPVIEHSEGARPAGEFRPAAWLPVQFRDKFYENWMVILPGKIVACDNQGRLVPAQYGIGDPNIVYTTDDVTAKVIDVRTGAVLAANATGTFAVSTVSSFMGTGQAMVVGKPIGVCPYPYLKWAGDAGSTDDGFNPAGYIQHNYNMQHRTAFLCDYVLELPLVPLYKSAQNLSKGSYSSVTKIVTGSALGSYLPMAANTVRTPFAFATNAAATTFVRQVATAAEVTEVGSWHVDLATGVISWYEASDPGGGTLFTVTHYYYAASTTVSKFACATGDLHAGDFVKCDANSNWVKATPLPEYGTVLDTNDTDLTWNYDDFSVIMGQVIEVEDFPKDLLDRVRTAYPSLSTDATGSLPGYAGQMDQMPGTATGGVSDKIHYAGGANKVVRINLVSR